MLVFGVVPVYFRVATAWADAPENFSGAGRSLPMGFIFGLSKNISSGTRMLGEGLIPQWMVGTPSAPGSGWTGKSPVTLSFLSRADQAHRFVPLSS